MKQADATHAREGRIRFTFNDRNFTARDGETLAAALLRAGVLTLTEEGDETAARGAFCWMGWCQECRVRYRGRLVEACRLVVHDGLEARSRWSSNAG